MRLELLVARLRGCRGLAAAFDFELAAGFSSGGIMAFLITSSIDETTLPGVSGSRSNDYTFTVDHAFRRWLVGTAKFGYGTTDYDGTRFDNRYFVEGDLVYKLSRTFHIKAQVRHDWLESSIAGANSDATVVMLGLRIQR